MNEPGDVRRKKCPRRSLMRSNRYEYTKTNQTLDPRTATMEDQDSAVLHDVMSDLLEQIALYIAAGKWNPARTQLQELTTNAAKFELCQRNEETLSRLIPVVKITIEAAKKATTLMDHKTASDLYKRVISIIATMGCHRDHDCIKCLCEAFICLVHNFFYCQKPHEIVSLLRTTGKQLEDLDCEETAGVLCHTNLELGMDFIKRTMVTSAKYHLQEADKFFQQVPSLQRTVTEAKLKTSLGISSLISNDLQESVSLLGYAKNMWQQLNWPLEEVDFILSTLKHYAEAQLQLRKSNKSVQDYEDVAEDLRKLHCVVYRYTKSMKVADVFTYLGINSFHAGNEKQSISYFLQALDLYKQVSCSDRNTEEILRLLRFIGVASYNSRDFVRACAIYHERLELLESNQTLDINRLKQVADCFASLGFTYSRLRNFDKMLMFYERALDLEVQLTSEDLQLIETNIGSLYHVKAVKLEREGEHSESGRFYELAENAFTKALRYSWKSFPFINYGYHLLFRGQYSQCLAFLQQGFLNSVIDKDTVEFDHTEDPILISDLKLELDGRDHIRVPAVIVSLYLKSIAQSKNDDVIYARLTTEQLQQEVTTCHYDEYYHEGFGLDQMRGLSYSLLGYAYRELDRRDQALRAFEQALAIAKPYPAALYNVTALTKALKNTKQN